MSVDDDDLARFAPADVLAALAPCLDEGRAQKLDAAAASRVTGVQVVLEDLRDPHNAGAALRSCEAMGVYTVHLISIQHRFRTSMRVTQGCEKWLDLHRFSDVEACAAELRRTGVKLYAAVPGAARALADIDPHERIALAFGNEHLGLSPRLRALADGEFTIPMYGMSQSLNVSVSVAVAVHVATEARRRALGRPGDLDEEALLRLRGRYYANDQREAAAVVERFVASRGGAG